MKTIAFATQKGGSGKSTLLVNSAVAAMEKGAKVYILEMDKQATIGQWDEVRLANGPETDMVSTEALEHALLALGKLEFDYAFIDTPGADNPGVAAASRHSDFIVVPVRPTPADVRGCVPTVQMLERLGKPFAFVINQCPSGSASSRTTETVKALSGFGQVAPQLIAARVDYQDALGSGYGVTEYGPKSKAAEEVRALWKWIKKQVENNG